MIPLARNCCTFLRTAQSITFLVLPSSEEVAEGSNATFECVARNGSQPVLVLWLLRRGQQQISSIVGSKSVEGTGGAIVGPNNGSPLTLTSVSRSLNGISVSCLAIINPIVQQEQPGPLATLNVTREFIILCKNMYIRQCMYGAYNITHA